MSVDIRPMLKSAQEAFVKFETENAMGHLWQALRILLEGCLADFEEAEEGISLWLKVSETMFPSSRQLVLLLKKLGDTLLANGRQAASLEIRHRACEIRYSAVKRWPKIPDAG